MELLDFIPLDHISEGRAPAAPDVDSRSFHKIFEQEFGISVDQ
jgi:hypothetical protein